MSLYGFYVVNSNITSNFYHVAKNVEIIYNLYIFWRGFIYGERN